MPLKIIRPSPNRKIPSSLIKSFGFARFALLVLLAKEE